MARALNIIVKCVGFAIIIILLVHPRCSLGGESPLILWHRVLISQQMIDRSPVLEVLPYPKVTNNPDMYCSLACGLRPWCQLECQSSSNECTLSNIIVTPTYNETSLDDVLNCFTKRARDIATGAKPTAINFHANRLKENVMDGIYTHDIDECFLAGGGAKWFLADLGEDKSFRQIRLILQPNSFAYIVNNLEVRFGSSAVVPPGGFAKYQLFGYFEGPGVPKQEVVFEVPEPVTARFVSFQKMAVDGFGVQLCHLEIR